MTIERAFLWLAEVLMFSAFFCFIAGFRARKSDRARHMRMGKLGATLVFIGLVAVEVLHRGLHWEFPIRSRTILHVHIAVSFAALVALTALAWTGMRGPKRLHVKLYLFFFPLFTASLVLSLAAFELW